MKKRYITPQVEVIAVETENIIAGSPTTTIEGEATEDARAPEFRRGQAWDDYDAW